MCLWSIWKICRKTGRIGLALTFHFVIFKHSNVATEHWVADEHLSTFVYVCCDLWHRFLFVLIKTNPLFPYSNIASILWDLYSPVGHQLTSPPTHMHTHWVPWGSNRHYVITIHRIVRGHCSFSLTDKSFVLSSSHSSTPRLPPALLKSAPSSVYCSPYVTLPPACTLKSAQSGSELLLKQTSCPGRPCPWGCKQVLRGPWGPQHTTHGSTLLQAAPPGCQQTERVVWFYSWRKINTRQMRGCYSSMVHKFLFLKSQRMKLSSKLLWNYEKYMSGNLLVRLIRHSYI